VLSLEVQLDVAARGDGQRMVAGLRRLGEEPAHLGGTFEIDVRRVDHPVGVVRPLARADRAQAVVSLMVFLQEKMHIVRRHEADAHLRRQLDQARPHARVVALVALQLDEEPLRAKNLQVALGGLPGRFPVAARHRGRDLALETGTGADQPFLTLGENLLVDTRPVVKPVEIAGAGQLEQIPVAGEVLRQQNQMVRRIGNGGLRPVEPAARRDVGLDPDDGLDVRGPGLGIELDRAEHVAVVRDGHRVHAQLLALLEEPLERDGPVEQGILAVQMEVCKSFVGHSLRNPKILVVSEAS
jgi:hypothetical protein